MGREKASTQILNNGGYHFLWVQHLKIILNRGLLGFCLFGGFFSLPQMVSGCKDMKQGQNFVCTRMGNKREKKKNNPDFMFCFGSSVLKFCTYHSGNTAYSIIRVCVYKVRDPLTLQIPFEMVSEPPFTFLVFQWLLREAQSWRRLIRLMNPLIIESLPRFFFQHLRPFVF